MDEFIASAVGGFFSGALANTYNLMIDINKFLNDEGVFDTIISSLYTLFGLFMLFRVLVSMLSYLIDPDKVNDKQVGAGKMIVRIVIVIVLLLTMDSFIFPLLKNLETIILDEDVIGRIFTSSGYSTDGDLAISTTKSELNDKFLWMDVDAAGGDGTSYKGHSCTEPFKRTTLGSILSFDYSADLFEFSQYYSGCSMQQVRARFSEYMDVAKTYGIETKVMPDSGCTDLTNCPNFTYYVFSNNASDSGYHNYRQCSSGQSCYSFTSTDSSYNIFTGFNMDRDDLARITANLMCRGADGKYNCPNISLKMNGTSGSVGEKRSFSCNYIFRDKNSNIYVENSNNSYTCSKTQYEFALSNQIILTFTETDERNGIFKSGGGNKKWAVSIQGTNNILNIGQGTVTKDPGLFTTDAVSGLDQFRCPSSIAGLSCSRNSSGGITCSKSGSASEIIFSSKAWTSIDNYYDTSGLTNYSSQYGKNPAWSEISGNYMVDMTKVCPDDKDVKDDAQQAVQDGNATNPVDGSCNGDYCGIDFAKDLVKAFIRRDNTQCPEDENNECYQAYLNYPTSSKANDDFAYHLKKNRLELDWLMAIIFCLVATVLMAIICIEVVVRNLKLWLLQVISPVAIVSYINPQDKNFNQWVKMYVSAYLDLFIKLIAIYAGSTFLSVILKNVQYADLGFGKIFMVAGILVFIKTIPNLISKLFGLEGSSTFKDSMGMLKAGLGVAAGGAIAAGASAWTGASAFNATRGQDKKDRAAALAHALGTGASSVLYGMGTGAKGNVMGGATHASDINTRRRSLYEAGYGGAAVLGSAMSMGLWDPNRKDEIIENAYDDVINSRKAMDDLIQSEISKGKDGYRIMGETGVASALNGLSIQQVDSVLASHKLNGEELTTDQAAEFSRVKAEHSEAAAAYYMKRVATGEVDDVKTATAMRTYDRTINHYAKSLGSKGPTADDERYKYDFTKFTSTSDVVASASAAEDMRNKALSTSSAADLAAAKNASMSSGKTYKSTKKIAEEGKSVFQGSDTRAEHIKNPNQK